MAHALSLLGYCSRREAERLIERRRVSVNGRTIETPATFVDPASDVLAVDGKEVAREPSRPKYLAVHKPRGVVSTVRDPHAERTVVQLVASSERLYPVGRLDKDSEGLIILTNDGSFANRVAHPRYQTEREYLALVAHRPSDADLQTLRRGVMLDGERTVPVRVEAPRSLSPAEIRALSDGSLEIPAPRFEVRARAENAKLATRYPQSRRGAWLRIVLREGRNREVRRMLEAVGHPVQRLVRTRVGPVRLGALRPGAHRELTQAEVRALVQGPGRGLGVRGRGLGPRPTVATELPASFADTPAEQASSSPGPPTPNSQPPAPALVVAIDGPSGAGKTTVGKLVAERLGAAFLDTGILYRALTLKAFEAGVRPDDEAALAALARDLAIETVATKGGDIVRLDGRDVTEAIRSPTVDAFVSQVASHAAVREALIPPQRRVADTGLAVLVGRDIGTVIFPDAQVKVFLEASAGERARRRAEQSGDTTAEAAVQHDMEQRDAQDRGRSVAPLEAAPDAVIIETDGVPIEEVVERVYSLVPTSARNSRYVG